MLSMCCIVSITSNIKKKNIGKRNREVGQGVKKGCLLLLRNLFSFIIWVFFPSLWLEYRLTRQRSCNCIFLLSWSIISCPLELTHDSMPLLCTFSRVFLTEKEFWLVTNQTVPQIRADDNFSDVHLVLRQHVLSKQP